MFIFCFDSEPSKALQRSMLKDKKLSNALVRPSSRPMVIFDGCEKKGRANVGKSRRSAPTVTPDASQLRPENFRAMCLEDELEPELPEAREVRLSGRRFIDRAELRAIRVGVICALVVHRR